MEDWMAIPVQESMTSSWLSTTQVELSSGRINLGHQVVILLRSYHRNLPRKIPSYTVKGSIIRSSGTTASASISISHSGSISFAT